MGFNRDVGEAPEVGAGEALLRVDGDHVEEDDAINAKFNEAAAAAGGKKKKKGPVTLKKKDAVNLAVIMLETRFKHKAVEKRYVEFGGGKAMTQDDYLEFYRSIKPTAPNELQVVVVRAEKLRAADGTAFGGAGSSDPYIICKVGKQLYRQS